MASGHIHAGGQNCIVRGNYLLILNSLWFNAGQMPDRQLSQRSFQSGCRRLRADSGSELAGLCRRGFGVGGQGGGLGAGAGGHGEFARGGAHPWMTHTWRAGRQHGARAQRPRSHAWPPRPCLRRPSPFCLGSCVAARSPSQRTRYTQLASRPAQTALSPRQGLCRKFRCG